MTRSELERVQTLIESAGPYLAEASELVNAMPDDAVAQQVGGVLQTIRAQSARVMELLLQAKRALDLP